MSSSPYIFEIPAAWAWVKVNDITTVIRGASPRPKGDPRYFGGPIPWIMISDVSREPGKYLTKTREGVTPEGAERSRLLNPGSLILSNSGTVCVPKLLGVSGCIHDGFVSFPSLPEEISKDFLYHWFDYIRPRVIQANKQGITQVNLNTEIVRELDVPIPPALEQRRIVAKIEELFSDLDAGVAALERAKANLKRYRAAVLKAAVEGKLTEAWRAEHPNTEPASKLLERILAERRQKWEADQLAKFAAAKKEPPKNWKAKYVEPTPPETTGLPELPEGWCWASVEQTSEVQGGIQKQPKRAPASNSFPFLRVANVHRDRLDLSEVHRIELFGDELDRLRLQPDDLLVVEGNGSKTEIGRSAIWKGEIEDCVHQNHIIRVRFLAGSSRYLNAYWNSPFGNARVMDQAASTSGLYTLSVTKVCALPIPLAPTAEQGQIVAEVEQRLSVIAAAEKEINHGLLRASRLRQSILKQAFEGKLVPQDPTDEPASVLLERLRAKQTIHEGNGKPDIRARNVLRATLKTAQNRQRMQ